MNGKLRVAGKGILCVGLAILCVVGYRYLKTPAPQTSADSEREVDADLEEIFAFADEVYAKVDDLYESHHKTLEEAMPDLLALEPAGSRYLAWNEGETEGFFWYSKDTYENEGPLEGLDPEWVELLNQLYRDYEMDAIWFQEGEILFEIAEDALIYVADPEQPPDHCNKLSDHWYHYWFEYGV